MHEALPSSRRALVEPLERRSLLAADYIISFYGLGGSGSFGADWLDKTVDDAGAEAGAVVRKYDEDEGGRALKDFLRSVDRNRNLRIDKREVASLDVASSATASAASRRSTSRVSVEGRPDDQGLPDWSGHADRYARDARPGGRAAVEDDQRRAE